MPSNEFLEELKKRAIESTSYKRIMADGIVENSEIAEQTERIRTLRSQLQSELSQEQFEKAMTYVIEIKVLQLLLAQSASLQESILKTGLQILSVIGDEGLERFGKLDTTLQGGTLPNKALQYDKWKILPNMVYRGYSVYNPADKSVPHLTGSLASIEDFFKRICVELSIRLPNEDDEQTDVVFPSELKIIEQNRLTALRHKETLSDTEVDIAKTALLNQPEFFLDHLVYRCALIADAVYSQKDMKNIGIPLANEEQLRNVFGYTYVKKFEKATTSINKFKVYYDERCKRFVLAFAGTGTSNKDWSNNIQQFSGSDATFYEQAIEVAELIQPAYRNNVLVTGHSLGGGLATTAAIAVNLEAIVFNPPFIHCKTLEKLKAGNIEQAKQSIQRFVVTGEILHSMNLLTGVLKDELLSVGNDVFLSGSEAEAKDSTWDIVTTAMGLGAFKKMAGKALNKGVALHLMPEVLAALMRMYLNDANGDE